MRKLREISKQTSDRSARLLTNLRHCRRRQIYKYCVFLYLLVLLSIRISKQFVLSVRQIIGILQRIAGLQDILR